MGDMVHITDDDFEWYCITLFSVGGVGGARATVAHSMQLAGDTSARRLSQAFPGSLRISGADQQVL